MFEVRSNIPFAHVLRDSHDVLGGDVLLARGGGLGDRLLSARRELVHEVPLPEADW